MTGDVSETITLQGSTQSFTAKFSESTNVPCIVNVNDSKML